MSIINGIIQAPVSIADVRTVLGETSNDLGTLCKSEKINPWAKYKPVVLDKVTHADEYDPVTKKWTGDWWKGGNKNCGFTEFSTQDIKAIFVTADDNLNGWAYRKPSGGSSMPFRLEDFIGYKHSAKQDWPHLFTNSSIQEDADFVVGFFSPIDLHPDGLNIHISDVGSLSECYFGVALRSEKDEYFVGTGGKYIGEGSNGIFFVATEGLAPGTYKVVPIACNAKHEKFKQVVRPDGSTIYYALPFMLSQTLTVSENSMRRQSGVNFRVTLNDVGQIIVRIDARKATDQFLNCELKIRFEGAKFYEPLQPGEYLKNIGTIAPGQTYTLTFDGANTSSRRNATLKLGIYELWTSVFNEAPYSRNTD
mgnify:CR=1 FL=1